MKKLTRYFFNGLLFLVPLIITIYICYMVFTKIESLLKLPVPGLGLVVIILIVLVTGFLTTHYLTRRFMKFIERLFEKLPLVKILYTAIKDLLGAFFGDKKGFDKPVLVQLTDKAGVMGFVTNESLERLGLKDKVAVYLPQSYNFAGNVIIVERSSVTPLAIDSSEMIKFILAGGTGKL